MQIKKPKTLTNKLFIFYLLSCAIIILSCNNNSNSSDDNITKKAQVDSLKLKLDILKFNNVKLSSKADSITKIWPVYEDFKNEVIRFQNYTLQDVISNIPTIEKTIDSLQKTIPKAVDNLPVTSRLNVLHTKAKHLLLLSNKQRPKLKAIKMIAERYPFEFNALNVQINEVFIELPDFD